MNENLIFYLNNVLKKLVALASNTLDNYKKLEDLESSNNYSSLTSTLEELKQAIENEDLYYIKLANDKDLILALLKKLEYFNSSSNDFALIQSENNKIYTRISLKLNEIVTEILKAKSPQMFNTSSKFEIYSQFHFENLILTLILFEMFLQKNPSIISKKSFINMKGTFSFMFPYVEHYLLSNDLNIPKELISTIDCLKTNIKNAFEISLIAQIKFEQIKSYLEKNKLSLLEILYLIFYMKILTYYNNSLLDNLNNIITNIDIDNQLKDLIKNFISDVDISKHVQKLSFSQ